MRKRGWCTIGWDVSSEGRPRGTVVSPEFRAELFARSFDAVLCREVLEHAPNPQGLLRELYQVTAAGGVCEITTPRPMDNPKIDDPVCVCYHWAHLCLRSVDALSTELLRVGFLIEEKTIWEFDQRYLCRR